MSTKNSKKSVDVRVGAFGLPKPQAEARNSGAGFTLVELLVVIAIIGVLSSVVVVSLNSARSKARDAKEVADLAALAVALEGYYDGNYGTDGSDTDTGYEYPTTLADLVEVGAIGVEPKDSAETAYTYNSAACTKANQGYIIKTTLENTSHSALSSDVDGTVCTLDCADPAYCVGTK